MTPETPRPSEPVPMSMSEARDRLRMMKSESISGRSRHLGRARSFDADKRTYEADQQRGIAESLDRDIDALNAAIVALKDAAPAPAAAPAVKQFAPPKCDDPACAFIHDAYDFRPTITIEIAHAQQINRRLSAPAADPSSLAEILTEPLVDRLQREQAELQQGWLECRQNVLKLIKERNAAEAERDALRSAVQALDLEVQRQARKHGPKSLVTDPYSRGVRDGYDSANEIIKALLHAEAAEPTP